MLASLRGAGALAFTTVLCSFVSAKRGEKDLMYSTTAQRSSSFKICFHGGIGVPGIPSDTDRNKSTSVGNWPINVERSRNLASTKFLGLGAKNAAAGPLPSPLIPWHATQFCSYTALPCSTNCGPESGFGGTGRSEKVMAAIAGACGCVLDEALGESLARLHPEAAST